MSKTTAKPFLKWAGGKTQLLNEFEKGFRKAIENGEVTNFVEPFIGGGAVFFHFNRLFSFDECHVFDINEELFLTYKVVQRNVEELIDYLNPIVEEFLSLSEEGRSDYFYTLRDEFNKSKPNNYKYYSKSWIPRAGQLIFLNKTCFNGLYRVNSKGEFNVPFGKHKNPKIVHPDLLRSDSEALENTKIYLKDFEESYQKINKNSFVYFDPPYRPLSTTASFTSYSSGGFDDNEQRRLAKFFEKCDKKGAKLMLSNSDPKNINPNDDFFDKLYSNSHFKIRRVPAKRMINCDGKKRGEISEIIVTNY